MYRIAIASSDGEQVDLHFGQAPSFLIYEIRADGVEFIEDRPVILHPEEEAHSEKNLHNRMELLHDCAAVFVLKIGMRSARFLYAHGIKSFEVTYALHHIFRTLMNNLKRGRVRIL